MKTDEFINGIEDLLVSETGDFGVAGVTHEEGDLGFLVSMQDGSEFYLAVTKQD